MLDLDEAIGAQGAARGNEIDDLARRFAAAAAALDDAAKALKR